MTDDYALLPDWTPFEPTAAPHLTMAQRREDYLRRGILFRDDLDSCRANYLRNCETFVNSRYIVHIHEVPAMVGSFEQWHVMIQRQDGLPPGPERYADFMRIRDELIGEEHEGAELYPARRREIDFANVYHLWVARSPASNFGAGL